MPREMLTDEQTELRASSHADSTIITHCQLTQQHWEMTRHLHQLMGYLYIHSKKITAMPYHIATLYRLILSEMLSE